MEEEIKINSSWLKAAVQRLFFLFPILQGSKRAWLNKRIKSLNPWFYELYISGLKVTPGIYPSKQVKDLSTTALLNRQRCRKTLLVDEVNRRIDFTGFRILDIACNCGYWSSIYLAENGASSMLGIEGREVFIKQASLYYSSLGIMDKANFIHGNIMEYDYDNFGKNEFNFILCAGILYHIKEHEYLLEKISNVNQDVLLIDTRVSEKGDAFVEPDNLCFNAIKETRDKKVPKIEDLMTILNKLSYNVYLLTPKFQSIEGVNGVDDYNTGRRICMLCRKKR